MGDMKLKEILESTGIPVKYRNIEPDKYMHMPFIGFHFVASENMGADDKVYYKTGRYSINLCTGYRDKKREQTIETALDNGCIFWDKYEDYIPEEGMFQITYEVTI